jgi:hypothetical protein
VWPPGPPRRRKQAHGQIRARALEAKSIEPALVQERRPLDEMLDMTPPSLGGIGLVETNRVRDELPESLDVGLPEDALRPAVVRGRHHGPVDRSLLEDDRDQAAGRSRGPAATHAVTVEIRERVRVRVAAQAEERGTLLMHVLEAREQPR